MPEVGNPCVTAVRSVRFTALDSPAISGDGDPRRTTHKGMFDKDLIYETQ